MTEQSDCEEQELREKEQDNAETSPQPGGNIEEQPPEVYREPGSGGEADRSSTDELQTSKEAETQADQLDDHEKIKDKHCVGNATATVKVVLVPEGHVMTVAFAIGLSIHELKCHLASELKVPAEVLQISLDGRVVEEHQSLMELGVQPQGSTRMEMSSTDPVTYPLRPFRPPEHDNMPDVITVHVQTDEGVLKEVVVEIERPHQQKAFLGGYKNRLTETEYHHAAVQTLPKRRPDRGVVLFDRDTQTVEVKSQAQQCSATTSTQLTGIECYVSHLNDKMVTPGKYITAEEHHGRRLRAVICLQSFARRWLAKQRVDQLRRDRDRHLAWLDLQRRRWREEKEEQMRDRHQRWLNPQRKQDFNLLYHTLENWRCEEEQWIVSSLRGAERKAALCSLLEQETQLIATIGRQQITVQNDNLDKTMKNILDKLAAPHKWGAEGRQIEVDTPDTIRARELRDLFSDISLFTVNHQQRLQALITLKQTVKEHECQLTRDIVDLIDREVDLMSREVKAANLRGLRKRISTLFLQFIKTPAFNPEVAKILKVPQNPSEMKNDVFRCWGCQRYLRSADFNPSAAAGVSNHCRKCVSLANIAGPRHDFTFYNNILRTLRADEQQLNKDAKIPFLLQVEDVCYLVESIWGSCSALQGSTDLSNLALVRWERQKDWSPWNCILLSKEETAAHMEVEDIHKVYEATFIHRIECKHTVARRHFSKVSVMAQHLDHHPCL